MARDIEITAENAQAVQAKLIAHYAQVREAQGAALGALVASAEFEAVEARLSAIAGELAGEPSLGALVRASAKGLATLKAYAERTALKATPASPTAA